MFQKILNSGYIHSTAFKLLINAKLLYFSSTQIEERSTRCYKT